MTRSAAVIASAVAVSAALVLFYAALGGGRYIPTAAADPCAPREWRSPQGVQAAIEQIALSTADGAACELRVSREELVLALGSEADLDRFATKHDLSRSDGRFVRPRVEIFPRLKHRRLDLNLLRGEGLSPTRRSVRRSDA